MSERDTLEKTIVFLQKREGIDKTLKLVRYTSRLVAALSPPGSAARARCDALQSSVGTSRKAYRLGKFLQHVHALRRLKTDGGWRGRAELVALWGEGLYYFLDQFTWLIKAGVLPKALEGRLSKASAWAEAVGYAANVALNAARIRALAAQEQAALEELLRLRQPPGSCARADGEGPPPAASAAGTCTAAQRRPHPTGGTLPPECQGSAASAAAGASRGVDAGARARALAATVLSLRYQRRLRCAYVVQDCADALTALNDITGARYESLRHPVMLALAGLVSASVSTYKYWP